VADGARGAERDRRPDRREARGARPRHRHADLQLRGQRRAGAGPARRRTPGPSRPRRAPRPT
jgi:hypothetical protein